MTHLTCASEKHSSIREHCGDRWVPRTVLTNDKTFVHGDILIDDPRPAEVPTPPPGSSSFSTVRTTGISICPG